MNSIYLGLFVLLGFHNQGDELERLYNLSQEAAKYAEVYAPPAQELRQKFSDAFAELAEAVYIGNTSKALAAVPQFASLGFCLVKTKSAGKTLFILIEETGKERGGGFYVLREKPRSAIVVMAPHRFFDVGTGRIALGVFRNEQGFALMTNTFHRYTGALSERRDKYGTDVAHRSDNFYFSAFKALLDRFPKATFIQIHGFDSVKRNSQHDLILSSGNTLNPLVERLAERLRAVLNGYVVSVYGKSVEELGGTTNVHAKEVAARGSTARFFHIELSDRLRKELLHNKALAKAFAKALAI
ncbi:MAG: hypothetical protein RMM17_00800 [Acidobacteriota bacterium]|nr:hypothetical protein [Blastocatellia bacterium]MDW8411206.1 hypothetical protein [Acidobacteriota bacterium]